VSVLLAPAAAAEKTGPFGPSPAGKALVRIADGSATGETLGPIVLEAASRRWTTRLLPPVVDVLEEWVREDPARLPVVWEAFGRASAGLRSGAAAEALVDAGEELRRRLAGPPRSRPVRSGWFRPRPGEGLSSPWPVRGVSSRELRERRVAFVDLRLPSGDRTAYVRSAWEAFLAPSCAAFLGGAVAETCAGVGLRPLRWAAFEAGLSGLSGDGSEPGLVDAYLGVEPALTGRVLDAVSYGFPEEPCEECVVLRSWLRKRPTRWQVRAALEPPLLP
jgi:hypothetical protein